MKYVGQLPSRNFTNWPLPVFHFANVTAGNPGKFGKLFLGQLFPVANALQIRAVGIRDKLRRYFRSKNGVMGFYRSC